MVYVNKKNNIKKKTTILLFVSGSYYSFSLAISVKIFNVHLQADFRPGFYITAMKKKFFILIAVLHLILVVVNITVYSDIFNQKNDDSKRYLRVASELVSFDYSNLDPYSNCGTAPGYPLFLALFKIFTRLNVYMVAITQALLYVLALYYLISNLYKKDYLSYPLCVLGFFLVLICPEIFEYNGRTLSESFAGSMILLIFGSMIGGLEKQWPRVIFLISLGFLILTRFEYLAIVPFLILFLIIRKKYVFSVVSVMVIVLLLSANGYKNYRIFGVFYPLSFAGGAVMYAGNNLNGDGSWHVIEKDINYIPESVQEKYLSIKNKEWNCRCLEEDKFYKNLAMDSWKGGNIGFQMMVIPLKVKKLWLLPGSFDYHSGLTHYDKGLQLGLLFDSNLWPWYAKYKHAFYLIIYWLFLIMIVAGFVLKIRERGFGLFDFSVILLFLVVTFLYSVPSYGIGRFHVPIFGLLAIYSAFTVKYLYKHYAKKDWEKYLYK